MSFTAWDYGVVGATLLLSAGVGVHFRGQRTAADYLMAGRDMSTLPVVLSLMATVQTAVGTLGFPGEVYLFGAQLFLYPLGFTIALVICTFVHTPVYFGLQVTSAYEYLELRFGKVTRTIISSLFIIQMVLFMSVGLYSPSIALSAVSGLSHLVSILLVGTVCAFYCTLGGMKAVLWTDFFQSILMFCALLSVIIKGCQDVGGVQEMVRIAQQGGRLQFFDTTFDLTKRFTVWSTLIGGFMYGMTTCAANQTQVQRLLTVSSLKKSQISLLASIPANLLMYYTIYTCGLVIYANFAGCDPLLLKNSGITSADQLIPYYMMSVFRAYPGMAGFCVSGVFCAALTSISSAVNSLAAVTYQDIVRPFCPPHKSSATVSKCLALFYSALCIGMTYVVGNIKAIIPAAFVVFTAIGGPTLSILTLGMLFTTPNQKGIVVGLLSGIALNAWIGTGAIVSDFPQAKLPQSIDSCPVSNGGGFSVLFNNSTTMPPQSSFNVTGLFDMTTEMTTTTDLISVLKEEIFPLYKLTFLLHPVPGTILTFILGYIVSFITGGDKNVDENLICPFRRHRLRAYLVKSEPKVEQNGIDQDNVIKNGKLKDHITEESKL